ncbi:hypothetical protein [Clostridium butyricum]|uniref:hypothetical protein n=1 Tax=Clostridium butyricum TaxID=1492 RepID=UPI00039F10B8|nr:hypothetical protein [Clostridium butyricum]MBZ5746305.1 hypothetical protein [Clostridium butyricum]MDB2158315.1 hypothetical protein [Clostridium butyricum]MDI9210052.1 hypothetical protein [Clostridium butyricum]BBK77724.1 hypothetical protein Cbu04g_27320 [Clostridium butyricum]GEQ24695.1 hypothetical protein CBU03nite_11180 [Clostridium butyricum]
MIISKIVEISDNREKAKKIVYWLQKNREEGKDLRSFGEILQEELDKVKATKDTGK